MPEVPLLPTSRRPPVDRVQRLLPGAAPQDVPGINAAAVVAPVVGLGPDDAVEAVVVQAGGGGVAGATAVAAVHTHIAAYGPVQQRGALGGGMVDGVGVL